MCNEIVDGVDFFLLSVSLPFFFKKNDNNNINININKLWLQGFVKEIIAPAANDSAAQPKKGDLVSVHYTGRLANGYQFDSSEGGDPLTVNIGVGQVIEGWDKGIMTMKYDSHLFLINHAKS